MTQIAQELIAESKIEGKIEVIPRLLKEGFSVEKIAEILELEIEQVRQAIAKMLNTIDSEDGEILEKMIQKMYKRLLSQSVSYSLGYPGNYNFNYSELFPFLGYHINNAGDPFQLGNYLVQSKIFEQYCIRYFAQLYNLSDHWGYVTTGGTEGNIYGILIGRDLYPNGILYYSQDSHYSIPKAAHLLKIPHVIINSLANGEINYEHLEQEISKRKEHSVILNLNLGTTMKGAVDRIDRAVEILEKLNIPFHIHCDAALGGMLLPFIEGAPKISFQDYPIGSIAISGHKFLGSPIPYGVVMTRKSLVENMDREIEYVGLGLKDTTITGSRNGLAVLFLWYAIFKRRKQFAQEVSTSIENARYLYKRLQIIGYNPMLNDFSITVVFDKPPKEICWKWQLATQDNLAHVVVMQHVSQEKIDLLIQDLSISTKINQK